MSPLAFGTFLVKFQNLQDVTLAVEPPLLTSAHGSCLTKAEENDDVRFYREAVAEVQAARMVLERTPACQLKFVSSKRAAVPIFFGSDGSQHGGRALKLRLGVLSSKT